MQRAARGLVCGAVRAPPARFFCAPPAVRAAGKEALLELRRRTGLPFLKCREALLRCGGALEQAEAWLQEEAQRQGWDRAIALRDRRAREGLVGLLREGPTAVMVEVNCETDFVAKTAEFRRVVEQAALGTMALCRGLPEPPGGCEKRLLREEELAQLRTGPEGGLLSDNLAVAIGKLGEKLALRRAGWLRVPRDSGFIGAYSHGGLAAPPAPVAMGTYGALVACEVTEPRAPEATLEEVGRKVAQHVVGLAPRELGTPQDELGGEEEQRLLAQGFLLEPGLSVGQFLQRQGVLSVTDFLRFRCGEEPHGETHSQPHGKTHSQPHGETHGGDGTRSHGG